MSSLSCTSRSSLVNLVIRFTLQSGKRTNCSNLDGHLHHRGLHSPYHLRQMNISASVCSSSSSNGGDNNGNWKFTTNNRGGLRSNVQRDIGESTILVQQGINIQEVPVAVLKSNNIPSNCGLENDEGNNQLQVRLSYVKLDPREEEAFIEGFNRFNSPKEILRILDTIPSSEVTPRVALCIVRKLFELENNFSFRNNGKSWLISTLTEGDTNNLESFGRMAIVSRLIDTIITSDNNQILLDTLNLLGLESNNSTALRYYFETNEEFLNYRLKLCNEALIRTIEGKFTLEDTCHAICSIGQIGKSDVTNKSNTNETLSKEMQSKFLDKMWSGILEKSSDINSENISVVFSTITHLRKSRRLVMNLIEKKILSIWWNLKLSQIANICQIITTERKLSKLNDSMQDPWGISTRVLMAFSRNLSLNLHKVTEDELCRIIESFHVLNFVDPTTEKTLSRYMKAKGVKISDPALVTLIMEYITKFRLRSSHILEGASEYLLIRKDLSPVQLTSLLIPFGYLSFRPPNSVKFWQHVEQVLVEKFVQFSPKDIIEILLSFVYLQKYPLNFVPQIFSPYFLDRLHTSEADFNTIHRTRSRLKLLDSALTLECGAKYSGPILPKDFSAKTMITDGRILRTVHHLQNQFKLLLKNSTCITETCVKLPNMPFNELYFVDLFINQISISASAEQEEHILEEANLKKPTDVLRNRFNPRASGGTGFIPNSNIELQNKPTSQDLIAVLIHTPEHYCSDDKHLIGPQIMRIRHLKLLGCTVVSLKLDRLAELRVHPQAFLDYLEESLTLAKVVTS